MKKTISITENYGNKLRDELSSSGLRGEVEIQVKNKKTGEVESQERHNLIVYGGREWLLRKAFASQIEGSDDKLLNSEILWFGVGNGGTEPGNPLQCGCTYGGDDDLYNPIRMRYTSDDNDQTLNPYYASRIMADGNVVNGYYKRLTYVSIKEDQANPFKKYGITRYPNLIGEIRLEVTSDDCCGQSELDKDYEKSYADINEAALFIADRRVQDPGKDGNVTQINTDFYNYDATGKRTYLEPLQELPEHTAGATEIKWEPGKPFPNTMVQYYDFYTYTLVTDETQANYVKTDAAGMKTYYKLTKFNDKPYKLGLYSSGANVCYGSIWMDNGNLKIRFENAESEEEEISASFPYPNTVTTMSDIMILSHGTVVLSFDRNKRFEDYDTVLFSLYYRNVYTEEPKLLLPQGNHYGSRTKYRAYLPIGYIWDAKYQDLCEEPYFNNNSIVRLVETTNISTPIDVIAVEPESQSYQVKVYTTQTDIKKVKEGQKFFLSVAGVAPVVPETDPATIIQIYDPSEDPEVVTALNTPYFIIERRGIVKTDYSAEPVKGYVYTENVGNPYTMFNRVTFSTIRMNSNRELIICWKVYF